MSMAAPAFAGPGRPVRADQRVSAVAMNPPHHCGGWVLMLGMTSGNRSWKVRIAVWSKMRPVCAAS
jgi:hypothetical protein